MLTYRREDGAAVVDDVLRVLPEHLGFVGDARMPYDINIDRYLTLEKARHFALFTVREDADLIGYMLVFLHPHINCRSVTMATIPTYFIRRRPNRGLILRRLLATVLNQLERVGIRHVTVDTAYRHSAGRLLEAMGFRPERVGYTIQIGQKEQPDAQR